MLRFIYRKIKNYIRFQISSINIPANFAVLHEKIHFRNISCCCAGEKYLKKKNKQTLKQTTKQTELPQFTGSVTLEYNFKIKRKTKSHTFSLLKGYCIP